jgi:hypothetical protein
MFRETLDGTLTIDPGLGSLVRERPRRRPDRSDAFDREPSTPAFSTRMTYAVAPPLDGDVARK